MLVARPGGGAGPRGIWNANVTATAEAKAEAVEADAHAAMAAGAGKRVPAFANNYGVNPEPGGETGGGGQRGADPD